MTERMKKSMAYFPMFIDMEGKQVLVAGAGTVGIRRIQILLEFGAQVTVAAPESLYMEELLASYGKNSSCAKERLIWLKGDYETYREKILASEKPYFLVLAATGRPDTDRMAAADGRKMGAFVNVASDREQSDFYFPGIARLGEVTAGVIAGGNNHKLAKKASEAVRELFHSKKEEWGKDTDHDRSKKKERY